jgi:hypothetical protein
MSADYCARVVRIEADFAEVLALNGAKHARISQRRFGLLAASVARTDGDFAEL